MHTQHFSVVEVSVKKKTKIIHVNYFTEQSDQMSPVCFCRICGFIRSNVYSCGLEYLTHPFPSLLKTALPNLVGFQAPPYPMPHICHGTNVRLQQMMLFTHT